MYKEKQIEEMAKVIKLVMPYDGCGKDLRCRFKADEEIDCPECSIANALYNAGYRKAYEACKETAKFVAQEFCYEIEQLGCCSYATLMATLERLGKKYGVEHEEEDKIFKIVLKLVRNKNKPDLHSFTAKTTRGSVYVEAREDGVLVCEETFNGNSYSFVGTAIAATNRLINIGIKADAIEI